MAVRVSKLLREANIGLQTLDEMLNALDYRESNLNLNTKIPDDIAETILSLCYKDVDLLKLIEENAKKTSNQQGSTPPLKIIGKIDLYGYNNPRSFSHETLNAGISSSNLYQNSLVQDPPEYDESHRSFWIDELVVLSPSGKANRLFIGDFDKKPDKPLFSVVIGSNGVGKSSIMKEIVDFFIDLHSCIRETQPKLSSANKMRLKGIKFHIDGVCCEVFRMERTYIAKIDGKIQALKNLRIPLIVACHFGAFDKFPVQKVNGSSQTRYDVPYYKYVGAHVNGNMISSSAIAFRLLFTLAENMDERQQLNISSILDFIGYDHRISLNYSLILKSKKGNGTRNLIQQKIQEDREYSNLSKEDKSCKVKELYDFYKNRISSSKTQHYCEIDIDNHSKIADDELKIIYKLKQYELISSTSVIFYKHGDEIKSEEMSSGEFAILSTVLSISAAASDSHTLVLLDEPELSLHPNWQMTLIDNLDRALRNQTCHLVIATHSHMLVSDLPMNRSCVAQIDKLKDGELVSNQISECTYGWSAEEVLLKVFKTATDRNRYFGERIGKLLEQMGNNTINPENVAEELKELQEISQHLSDVDPMKAILNTIVEAYK